MRRMDSSCTSMCTTVSNRPVELKPIAALVISTGILQDEQRIIENGRGFLEAYTMLLQILRGLRVVPHKSGVVMNERAIRHE